MSVMFVTRLHKVTNSQNKDGKYPIVLQITWNRKVRRKRLGLFALPEQWDFNNHEFKKGVHSRWERNEEVEAFEKKAKSIFKRHFTERNFDYKKFSDLFEDKPVEEMKAAEFCFKVSEEFKKKKQIGSSKYYYSVATAILKVSPKDIRFEEFTEDWLRDFEDYYQERGIKCYNYMVHLRALFNKAVQKKVADYKHHPFKNPYTNPYGYDFAHLKKSKIGQFGNRIKDLTKEQLVELTKYEPISEKEEKYLSVWFFSFYNFGVNLIDIANMKWSDIKNGRWYYARSKTGTSLRNGKPLLPEALEIIEKYGNKKAKYVFDILNGFDQDEETKDDRVRAYVRYIRRACVRISKRLGYDGYFTFYSARHTAATYALNQGADRNTVSHLLDHANFSTIDNYAGRADDEKVLAAMEILRVG